MIVETNCQNAIKLIMEDDDDENHPNRILIDDCKELKLEMNTPLTHRLQEGNRCANVLAKMGAEQNEQEVRLLVPPNEIL